MCGPDRARAVVAAGDERVGHVVGAFDVQVPVGHIVQKTVYRGEAHPAVGEPEERLVDAGPVPLTADLEEVVAPDNGDVVQHLEPEVVCGMQRNEERHAHAVSGEAIRTDKADVGVGEGPSSRRVDRHLRTVAAGPPGPTGTETRSTVTTRAARSGFRSRRGSGPARARWRFGPRSPRRRCRSPARSGCSCTSAWRCASGSGGSRACPGTRWRRWSG